jgi:general secretion pathway protein D
VDLTGDLTYGLEYALQQRSAAGASLPPFLADFGVSSAGTVTASGALPYGQTRQLLAFLTANENRTRVRTLSAPIVLATDSTNARIQVGASVPVLTSQGATGVSLAGTSAFSQTISNVDTGIILTVTPRISSTGLVSLTINQEISNEEPPPPGTAIGSPSFLKRSVTTHAVAQDGQTIALGGLISYTHSLTTTRIPLLGDIPLIGGLFGSTNYNTTETELIVLLTPRIVSTLPGAIEATRELRDKLRDLKREFKKDKLMNP